MSIFNENDEFWISPKTQESLKKAKKDLEEWHKLPRKEREQVAMRFAPKKLVIVKRGINED